MTNTILWTASVTPFTKDGKEIDYTSFEKILHKQDQSGNGILLLGSTGEGLLICDQEKLAILNFAFSLNLNSPIMVNVPSIEISGTLSFIESCKNYPISAFLMTVPVYTKPGIMGQTKWFETLLNASNTPAMLYNIPSRSGIRLHPECIKNLSSHPNLWAIKDSGGGVDSVVQYQLAAPKISVYCGDDNMMPAMAAYGAKGLVSVASNIWPTLTHKYTQQSLRGKCSQTEIWFQACQQLFSASNPIGAKALMHALGQISHNTTRPPLSMEDLPSVDALLKADQLIQTWGKTHGS
ncbi:MAG: 4-hydroxy-tetrahydrodipicolinate synthase [Alphaproteobacteria bacterium]|nr:4-hydroxy-tetrahydrodipicolinate synthase [Alphaproteobacteria bacterium]OJV47176.1 MAG: 4-hydroxy-tetrahydrodipicolinate synthase [Alphaproteobacteria bacterium 43-37]